MIKLRHRLSLRISLALSIVTVPLLGAAAVWISSGESSEIEDLTVQKGRIAAIAGANASSAILENGLTSGEIKLEDLLHPSYLEIEFPGCPEDRVVTGATRAAPDACQSIEVEDPRFHTAFDRYTDSRGIRQIQDAILASSPEFRYASLIDRNGYVPTPDTVQGQLPNGNPKHDRAFARSKIKYNGEQLTAANFIASEREPTLVLPYTRSTGEVELDVAATVFVRGRPFGAFRVGVRRDHIEARQRIRVIDLAVVFGASAIFMVAWIFLMLLRSMLPLEDLARRADEISTGEGLDDEIRTGRRDEIGAVTRSVNRLRFSLSAAMRRLDAPVPPEKKSADPAR